MSKYLFATLHTQNGQRVGSVQNTWDEGRQTLAVTVQDISVGSECTCRLVLADGRRQHAGAPSTNDRSGIRWVIAPPDSQVARIEVLTSPGHTWATATL